jgi:hypothetical protein
MLAAAMGASTTATQYGATQVGLEPAPPSDGPGQIVNIGTIQHVDGTSPLAPKPQTPVSQPFAYRLKRRREEEELEFPPLNYAPSFPRAGRHRYNRSARRHARNGWSRQR